MSTLPDANTIVVDTDPEPTEVLVTAHLLPNVVVVERHSLTTETLQGSHLNTGRWRYFIGATCSARNVRVL